MPPIGFCEILFSCMSFLNYGIAVATEADGTISVVAFPSESYMLLFVPMRFELADRR